VPLQDLEMGGPGSWLDVPPARPADVIGDYFRRLFKTSDICLTRSCSQALAIAAQAVIRAPDDEVIVLDRSLGCWPAQLQAQGARVVYTRRAPSGTPDVASIAAACTARTRAIVVVKPGQPDGNHLPA
jgi:aspartate/methionine/tyrosine aminotransferase